MTEGEKVLGVSRQALNDMVNGKEERNSGIEATQGRGFRHASFGGSHEPAAFSWTKLSLNKLSASSPRPLAPFLAFEGRFGLHSR